MREKEIIEFIRSVRDGFATRKISKQHFVKAVKEYIAGLSEETERVRPLMEEFKKLYPEEKKKIDSDFTKAWVANLARLEGLLLEFEQLSDEDEQKAGDK